MRALIIAVALLAFGATAHADKYDCDVDPATMSREQTTYCVAKDLAELLDALRALQDALNDLDDQ